MQALAGWMLGLLLGMRHALEPDHLAAVSTLISEQRSPQRGLVLGAFWGVGHTLALLAVGIALALLDARISAPLADVFELGVAAMLIALGTSALTAFVLAGLPSTSARLIYIALFGMGSAAGMALISGAAGWPLARLGESPALARGLTAVSGFASATLGVFWAWPLASRLFSGA